MTIQEFPAVILASASPRRKELLAQIGLSPVVFPADADEHAAERDPARLVEILSGRKARAVLERLKAAGTDRSGTAGYPADVRAVLESGKPFCILGSDTVVAADGRILGKPSSHEEAAEMIRLIAGREHHVYTGVTLIRAERKESCGAGCEADGGASLPDPGESLRETASDTFSVCTAVYVSPMDEEEILVYAKSEEPMDKAGAYGIQGSFGRHIGRIDGDYNTVVGLPAAEVYNHIRRLFSQDTASINEFNGGIIRHGDHL